MGACPHRSWKLAFVSGFWGRKPHQALPLDPAGGLPSPRSPLTPVANSWLRPCLAYVNKLQYSRLGNGEYTCAYIGLYMRLIGPRR